MSLGLYVHYPFCTNVCAYCDYCKLQYDRDLESSFFEALLIETRLAGEQMSSKDKSISTIFIGGGTPSLSNADQFHRWLEEAHKYFHFDADLEWSLECNPESATLDKLSAFKELGVTRPTFGVQSFDTDLLKLLDRRHHAHHSQRAVYLANSLGFTSFGCDLIFGLPGQTARMLAADLRQLVELEPPHISLYQLTVEENTPLAQQVECGEITLPDDDMMYTLYRLGCEQLAEHGYYRYEISSFARPGHQCRHNLGYWRGDNYLGLGPSAHSFIGEERYANIADLHQYIKSINNGKRPLIYDESGAKERRAEAIMVGFHLTEGIDRDRFLERFGSLPEACLARDQLEQLMKSGHVVLDESSLRLSTEGLYLADEITRRLLP